MISIFNDFNSTTDFYPNITIICFYIVLKKTFEKLLMWVGSFNQKYI